jgi:hypothetical protein
MTAATAFSANVLDVGQPEIRIGVFRDLGVSRQLDVKGTSRSNPIDLFSEWPAIRSGRAKRS